MAEHAKLSASRSHIWLNCTPAIRMSEGIPDRDTPYTQEGTVAHRLAELTLGGIYGLISDKEQEAGVKEVEASEYYSEEMRTSINEYVDWVQEIYNEAAARSADCELLTEQRLDFSAWVPGGFGTGDVIIVADGVLTVIDLKYGKGVPVSAVENPQLMLYGLGAYDAFSLSNEISTVRMMINQPRLDSISAYELPVEELLRWGDEYVKPRAELAIKGEGDAVPGDWCRFCKCKALCRARADKALEAARFEFRKPDLLTDEEIGEVLATADLLKAWAEDVKSYAQQEAVQNGRQWPGWKLVEGRSNRRFTDPAQVEERLLAAGFEKVLLYKDPELLGISAMEKVVGGRKKLEKLLPGLIVKPPGAPTLVPESDKRPIYNSAQEDFKEEK